MKNLPARVRQFAKRYRVANGKGFRLRDIDPADTAQLESADADRARETLPADHKWFTHLVVAAAIVDALAELGFHYPKLSGEQRRALAAARRELTRG